MTKPIDSVEWLQAYCEKWPSVDGPDTDARDHILAVIKRLETALALVEVGRSDKSVARVLRGQDQ